MTSTPHDGSTGSPDEGSPTDAALQEEADAGTHEGTHAGSDSSTGASDAGTANDTTVGDRDDGHSGATPHTEIQESDPNADSRDGLSGEMGVSSERRGPVRGGDGDVTYGTAPTYKDDEPEGDVPPEQTADDGRPEPHPDNPGPHELDTDSNPGHGI
jgi:hypothetical protein